MNPQTSLTFTTNYIKRMLSPKYKITEIVSCVNI